MLASLILHGIDFSRLDKVQTNFAFFFFLSLSALLVVQAITFARTRASCAWC